MAQPGQVDYDAMAKLAQTTAQPASSVDFDAIANQVSGTAPALSDEQILRSGGVPASLSGPAGVKIPKALQGKPVPERGSLMDDYHKMYGPPKTWAEANAEAKQNATGAAKSLGEHLFRLAGGTQGRGSALGSLAYMAGVPEGQVPHILTPQNDQQRLGGKAESVAEFFAPSLLGKADKAGLFLQSNKLLNLTGRAARIANAAREAALTGGIEAGQGGTPTQVGIAAGLGASGPLVIEPLVQGAANLVNKIRMRWNPGSRPLDAIFSALKPKLARQQFDVATEKTAPEILRAEAEGTGGTGAETVDLQTLLDNIRQSKRNVWSTAADRMQRAQPTRLDVYQNTVSNIQPRSLPAPKIDIETGVQQAVGGSEGGVIPMTSRPVTRSIEPTPESAPEVINGAIAGKVAQSKVGTQVKVVPQRVLGEPNPHVEQLGTQAATVPQRSLSPTTETTEQYLTGSSHPELQGELSNPAILSTNDPKALHDTLERLYKVASDTEQMARMNPAERSAILDQVERLRRAVPVDATPRNAYIMGSEAAGAASQVLEGRMIPTSPEQASAVANIVDFYNRPLTLTEAEEAAQGINALLDMKLYGVPPAVRNDAIKLHPELYALELIKNNLRAQQEAALERLVGQGIKEPKLMYGYLREMEKAAEKRLPIAQRQQPVGLIEGLNVPRGIFHVLEGIGGLNPAKTIGGIAEIGIAQHMREMNRSDRLVEEAYKNIRKNKGAVATGPREKSVIPAQLGRMIQSARASKRTQDGTPALGYSGEF